MKQFKRLFILIALVVGVISSLEAKKSYKYEVCVTAIFQNEARWMKEWIEYHKLIGVEHFYLYNNLSTDNYKQVLQPYIKSGLVELHEWPYKSSSVTHWTKIQSDAYMDAIKRSKGRSRWLAVLDLDEFIVPLTTDNIATFLKPYDGFGGLVVHWQLFGTSGVDQVPADRLMIEMLTMKANDTYGENAFVKTILHPEAVKSMSDPHFAHYKNEQFQVNSHMARTPNSNNTDFDLEYIRINHYWSRDEHHFFNIKSPRRASWQEGLNGQLARLRNLNEVEDVAIQRFVPALRKNMGLDP